MPENAECKVIADQLHDLLHNKSIENVEILGGKFVNKKPKGWDILGELLPVSCIKVYNKGKKIFFDLGSSDNKIDGWFISSLGMTGKWTTSLEKHSHIVLKFNDGTNVYYTDSRRFGNFDITNDINIYNEWRYKKLAPTFIGVDRIDEDQFLDRIKKQRKTLNISKILLDQDRVCSGIGLYVLVETLYASKISPHRTAGSLSDNDYINLYNNADSIIKSAYKHKGMTFRDFKDTSGAKGEYASFLKIYGKSHDEYDNKIIKDKLCGRNIAWVPDVQK